MFGGVTGKPILAAKRIIYPRLDAVAGKPIGTFPPVLDAETGALRRQTFLERTATQAAARLRFAVGPGHLIMESQHFGDSFAQKRTLVGPGSEAPNVHRPQIDARLPFAHPFREVFARSPRAGNSHGIESRRDEQAR